MRSRTVLWLLPLAALYAADVVCCAAARIAVFSWLATTSARRRLIRRLRADSA